MRRLRLWKDTAEGGQEELEGRRSSGQDRRSMHLAGPERRLLPSYTLGCTHWGTERIRG
jgi:hypothetical protein